MSENYEHDLFELIRKDGSNLKKDDVVKYLNIDGFDVNKAIFADGAKPGRDDPDFIICEAVEDCNLEIIEALVNKGANLNLFEDGIGLNPVIMAAATGKLDVVKLLIDNKADLLIKDFMGKTALMEAMMFDYPEIVNLILENMGNSEKAILDKSLTLFSLVDDCDYDMAKLLLENGANPNVLDEELGLSSLQMVAKEISLEKIDIPFVDLLLDYGARIKINRSDEISDVERLICGMIKQRADKERQQIIDKEIAVNSVQISIIKKAMAKKPKIRSLKI